MANFIPKIIYTPSGGGPTTIAFEFPPSGDPLSEEIKSVGAEAISASGVEQFSEFYQREILSIKFKNLSKTLLDELRTFFTTHAAKGLPFDYYPSEDEAAFEVYRLDRKQIKIKRTSPDAGDFRYAAEIKIRRVL